MEDIESLPEIIQAPLTLLNDTFSSEVTATSLELRILVKNDLETLAFALPLSYWVSFFRYLKQVESVVVEKEDKAVRALCLIEQMLCDFYSESELADLAK